MFIARSIPIPAPFGGAEFNQSFSTPDRSAPPNRAGGVTPRYYRHVTPYAVKRVNCSNDAEIKHLENSGKLDLIKIKFLLCFTVLIIT